MEAGDDHEDEYTVQTQERVIETDSGQHTLYLVKVPEESQSRLKWWVFIRQVGSPFTDSEPCAKTVADLANLEHGGESESLTLLWVPD